MNIISLWTSEMTNLLLMPSCYSSPDDLHAQKDYICFKQGLNTWLLLSSLHSFIAH